MLFYQNMILRVQGKDKESVEHLEKFESVMNDKLKVKEIKGIWFMYFAIVKPLCAVAEKLSVLT